MAPVAVIRSWDAAGPGRSVIAQTVSPRPAAISDYREKLPRQCVNSATTPAAIKDKVY